MVLTVNSDYFLKQR